MWRIVWENIESRCLWICLAEHLLRFVWDCPKFIWSFSEFDLSTVLLLELSSGIIIYLSMCSLKLESGVVDVTILFYSIVIVWGWWHHCSINSFSSFCLSLAEKVAGLLHFLVLMKNGKRAQQMPEPLFPRPVYLWDNALHFEGLCWFSWFG